MRLSSIFPFVLCLLASLSSSVTSAREPESLPTRTDAPDFEKHLAKAKAELASAGKKLQRARRKSKIKTTVKVVSVHGQDGKKLAKTVKKIYRRCPGFAIAAVPSMGCLMIRADEKTMEKVLREIMRRRKL